MTFTHKIVKLAFNARMNEIEYLRRNPHIVQYSEFQKLMKHLSNTIYGKDRGVKEALSYNEFSNIVEVTDYNSLEPYINRVRSGEKYVLWDESIKWFAKSSGTTSSKSKFIPISQDSIYECQYRGMKDVIAIVAHTQDHFNIFSGKTLTLGGSYIVDDDLQQDMRSGDLSSILIEHTPKLLSLYRAPSKEIALEPDFSKKIELIARECSSKNITSFTGVPSWNLVMLEAVLDYTGKDNISDVWPNMELFMHGGTSFEPYRDVYKKLISSSNMRYIDNYNASEGFFAIQDDPMSDDMLLMLDYGVFYEFISISDLGDNTKVIPLEEVKVGVNYAIIITTNGGLWRYMIGDTVKFTSVNPYKIKITGRTKQYINTFGEEVIVDNSDNAIMLAAKATNAVVCEYSAAPVYMDFGKKGKHEWIIEFDKEPDSFEQFCKELDKGLQSVNSDYEAKRTNNGTLEFPIISMVEKGTFYRWMESRGRVGGQNKVPRLANTREYIDAILKFIN